MLTTRNVLLWVHILVAFVTIGPFLLFDVLTPGIVRAGNVPVLRGLERLTKVLGPVTAIIPIVGIVLVARSDVYTFRQAWIVGAIVGYVVIVAIGIGVLGKSVTRAIERLEAGQDAAAEASRLRVFGLVNSAIILTIVWLMVAKPGL